jgi:hypothetical protein
MTTVDSKLAREEWDFEAFTQKIGDRLDFLHSYEFGRELEQVVAAHEEDRLAYRRINEGIWHCVLVKRDPKNVVALDDCFPYLHDPECYDDGFLPSGEVPRFEYEVIDAPPGFPTTPYLLLDPAHAPGFRSRFPGNRIRKRRSFTSAYAYPEGWVTGNRDVVAPSQVHHVHIDVDLPRTEIKKDFDHWLDTIVPARPAIDPRGRGGDRELIADLKALGVWRLLLVNGDDVKEARDYVRAVKKTDLFVRSADWRNNQRRAQMILDDWASRDICG